MVIAMLYTSIGNRYWYWVLVSLEANIIGYWILGVFLGIVLTLGLADGWETSSRRSLIIPDENE